MIKFSPRSALALGAVCVLLLSAGLARAQLPIPEERFTYKPCRIFNLKPGLTVTVPTQCAKRDGQTMIIFVLKGGVAGANVRVSGVGEFRISGPKRLRVRVGTTISLVRVSSLGGPGGVYLAIMDYSKPIPVGSVWDDQDPMTGQPPE
jgi:hypothetical protein